MRNLFLVDGAAGAGKSDLLAYINRSYTPQLANIITKHTTRKMRPWEQNAPADLHVVEPDAFTPYRDRREYFTYTYGKAEYAISRAELQASIAESVHTFLIVRSREAIHVLTNACSHAARVIPIFIYSDRKYIEERLKRQEQQLRDAGESEIADQFAANIPQRLERGTELWKDYLREPFLYAHVLINNFEKKDFESLIEKLLDRYAT